MASKWAALGDFDLEETDANNARAWMQGVEQNQDSHVAAWSTTLESNTRASSTASRWAALPPSGDSPPGDLELADPVVSVAVSSKEIIQQQIAAINGTTTLAELRQTVKNLNAVLVPCTYGCQ